MRARIDAAARSVGRDPGEITSAYNIPVRVEAGATGSAETVAGSADQVVDRLRRLIGIGFTAINLMPFGADGRQQMERIATEVLPALRSA